MTPRNHRTPWTRHLLLAFAVLPFLGSPTALAEEGEAKPAAAFDERWDFKKEEDRKRAVGAATGEALRRMKKPKYRQGRIVMLEPWWKSTTSLALPAPHAERVREIEGRFTVIMSKGTEGLGFAWLDTAKHGTEGGAPEVAKWEAPSIAGSLGIGIDARNPVNREPFRGSGNAYDRPQHELSLHWDGMEIAKRTTPAEFRDEKPHVFRYRFAFVVGGCEVSVWMNDTPLYERYFIAHALPYVGRPAFGARNGETAGEIAITDIAHSGREVIPAAPAPLTVKAIERQLNDQRHPKTEAIADFPLDTDKYGRIIATLRLDKPETRFDPWDRFAAVYAFDDEGTRHEIFRYITPYHRGHVWRVDVTHWRSLLRGKRRIVQRCGTQGEGWVVTVRFDLHEGPAEDYAYQVVKMWSGKPEIGNPEKPVTDFYTPQQVTVDETCWRAEVRTVVTGHGMTPNSNNAAEFMPIDRTITVNGRSVTNRLWKTDCYLNPCRPQGGTWKYDRAGWAPGSVVDPWVVDVSEEAKSGTLDIAYTLAPYVNENRGKTWAPYHHTEAQVVLYRKAPLGPLTQPTPPVLPPLDWGAVTYEVRATGEPEAVKLVEGLGPKKFVWRWNKRHVRAEDEAGLNAGAMIVDREAGEAVWLDVAAKKGERTRAVTDLDQTDEKVRALMKHHFETELEATEETGEILGYPVRRYRIVKSAFVRGKGSLWITEAVRLPRMRLDVNWANRRWVAPLPLSIPVDGTILKAEIEEQGALVTVQATALDKGRQGKKRFKVPEGFDVPALPPKKADDKQANKPKDRDGEKAADSDK